MQTVDVAYAEEWKFDHGIMVPLHFLTPRFDLPVIPVNINCQGPPLTPLHRAWAFGEALRRACDAVPERIALVGTGGISHWPATPDSGKINEAWDREFLDRWCAQRPRRRCSPTATRPPTAKPARAASRSAPSSPSPPRRAGTGELRIYAPIPIFSVGCTVGDDGDRMRREEPRCRTSSIHYTANLEPDADIGALCSDARRGHRARSATTPASASSRSAARACWPIRPRTIAVADGAPDRAFVLPQRAHRRRARARAGRRRPARR